MSTADDSTMRLDHRQILLVWSLFLLIMLGAGLRFVHGRGTDVQGPECEWIAESLAGGHGYSFPGNHRWLFFGETSRDEYSPTAWLPPVYPLFMAACLAALGEEGRLAIVAFQVVCLTLTCVVLYHLGRMVVGPWTGLLAGTLLAVFPAAEYTVRRNLGEAALTALLICVYAVVLLWCLRRVTARRGAGLGAVIGLTVLTHGSTLLFGPIAVFAVLVATRFRARGWTTSIVITATCLAVMAPWTIRNYLVFGELVPSRTGLGYNTYLSNNVLAETSRPELAACDGPPAWTADSDWDAIMKARTHMRIREMLVRSFECVGVPAADAMRRPTLRFGPREDGRVLPDPPAGFVDMNEPQRDRVYLREYGAFVRAHPEVAVGLAALKGLAFFFGREGGTDPSWGLGKVIIAAVALLGVLVAGRNPRVWLLLALVLAYAFPYCLGLPFYYRYRFPIEPILLLLASHFLVVVGGAAYRAALRHFAGRRLLEADAGDG